MKTLFAITHINRDGVRQLSRANQGQNQFATATEAADYLEKFNQNNAQTSLAQIFGAQAVGTFAVRPVQCYDRGGAIGIYFED